MLYIYVKNKKRLMKIIAILLLLSSFVTNKVIGQTANENSEVTKQTTVFFAQCMLSITDEEELKAIEVNLRSNPYISIVRVDIPTRRVFLLTKNISFFSEENVTSWLGDAASKASCIQVGIYGIDPVANYPFTNCN
jgi:hypothetical protein